MSILAIGFAEPRLVKCRCCKGTGQGFGTLRCDCCNGDGGYEVDDPCLATLAANLAVAGGLCRAWLDGFQSAALLHSANVCGYWRPGCQRSAL